MRVAARNQFGISALSAEVAVHVVPSAPDRPTATRAVATVDTVQIEWTPSARGWRATSYVLDVGSAPGLADLGSLPVTATSFSASGVPPGRYYLRVRAMNASGASAASDEAMLVVMIPVGGHR